MLKIERLQRLLLRMDEMGVRVRYVRHAAVTSGLCRIGSARTLFLEETLTTAEQLAIVQAAFKQLETPMKMTSSGQPATKVAA